MSGPLDAPRQAIARFLSVLFCIAVTSCSGAVHALPTTAGASSASLARVPSFSVAAALAAQGRWLRRQTLADGAILYGNNEIEPYYANLAAIGEAGVPSELGRVRRWMGWYVAHLNAKDRWGLSGTVYDYRYDPATRSEVSLNKADSVDSYAATFMTLARTLYDTGDPVSQRYVKTLHVPLETMAAMLLQIRQPDGMTIALPSYPVAYLMDNSEVYRGLRDLAYLESVAFADRAKAQLYDTTARGVGAGIASMWSAGGARYDEEKQEPHGPLTRARWSVWYPDATAQLFPMLQGVIPAESPRARALWASFNRAFPAWDRFEFPDNEPWALVAQTALVEHDTTRANVYVHSVQRRFSPSFAWPWYDMEAGWYMRTLESLLRRARRQGNPEQGANRLDV